MREGWTKTTLGAVLETITDRAGDHGPELVLSVTEKRGVIPQEEVFKKRIATLDTSKYKVLQRLDIAFNPYLVWCGAVGQWLGPAPGITSPVYECFRVANGCDPRFVGLVLESGLLTSYFDATAVGSIQRRRRTTVPVFRSAPLLLPPLAEQRRIVDLVQSVDIAQNAATLTIEAHSELSMRLVDNWVQDWTGPMTRLGDVAKMGSGSGWKSSDESPEAGKGRLRVLGITNTPPGGAITLDQVKYVEDLPESTPKQSESSLLMIRTNGNRKRIGNVYRIPPEARDCAFSAFQIGLHFGSPEETTFAYWMLSESRIQSQISFAASGSTGLGNVAITWLRNLEIPWPASDASRITASQLFDAAGECVIAGRNLQDSYVELRSCLLSQLLSGTHGIAASYDSILEMVS